MLARVATLVTLASALAFAQTDTAREERFRQDIDLFVDRLVNLHPAPFTSFPRTDFDAAIASLKANAGQLADYQILGGLLAITAKIGDSHTTFGGLPVSSYPLRFRWLSDGFYAISIGPASSAAFGRKLTAIDGRPAAEAFEKIRTLIPAENLSWARHIGAQYLAVSELLHYAGVTNERSTATFEFEGGVVLALQPGPVTVSFPRKARPRPPVSSQFATLNYWFDYFPETGTLYIKYNVCGEDTVLPMTDFANQVVDYLKDKLFNRAIIDIRNNTGGNSAVTDRLFTTIGLAIEAGKIPFPKDGAFGIISRETFSSGMLAAMDLRRNQTILVGEPTGGIPNSFGDVRVFNLPNSGWRFQVSTKTFRFPDYDGKDSVAPDIQVDFTIDDLANERDPFLAAILR